jgi:putative tryptophan/tyrosine transport system substrate-binding protein
MQQSRAVSRCAILLVREALEALAVKRREFMSLLGGAAAWPLAARAQQAGKIRRIGVLLLNRDATVLGPFQQGLQALGYVEGKNVTFEYRYAEGRVERLPDLAAELVRLNPDLIFAVGAEVAPIASNATRTIPLVVVVSNDPVQAGLVTSLGRPGGNVTGVTFVSDQLAGKNIELLKEAAPHISRVAILWDPDHADPEFRESQRAAHTFQVNLQSLEVSGSAEIDHALQAAARERAEAIIVVISRRISLHRRQIGEFAAKQRVILVGGVKHWTEVGALLTYGPNPSELIRLTGTYVDKILKGAKPADLPVQQPSRFELVLNLKAAKALGLSLPPTLLALADEVIE